MLKTTNCFALVMHSNQSCNLGANQLHCLNEQNPLTTAIVHKYSVNQSNTKKWFEIFRLIATWYTSGLNYFSNFQINYLHFIVSFIQIIISLYINNCSESHTNEFVKDTIYRLDFISNKHQAFIR